MFCFISPKLNDFFPKKKKVSVNRWVLNDKRIVNFHLRRLAIDCWLLRVPLFAQTSEVIGNSKNTLNAQRQNFCGENYYRHFQSYVYVLLVRNRNNRKRLLASVNISTNQRGEITNAFYDLLASFTHLLSCSINTKIIHEIDNKLITHERSSLILISSHHEASQLRRRSH